MEAYAEALTYAIPGFVLLIVLESIIARIMGKKINKGMDVISSLSSGMTNTLKSMMGLGVVIISYTFMESHIGLFDIKSTLWLYIIAFIGLDFAGYWGHRFNHTINVFWNRHIVHHSSEEFNLSCALRQEASAFIGVYFFMYIPMAIIGVPPEVVAISGPIHLFAQFWYHTRLINKMGFLEHIIVTPSHHRVHHAINPEYIDKNYSEIFIIWDKLFGTFQEELADVPPVYGTKRPARTWNPFIINYMHIWGIIQDAWRTNSWWDKLRIWFMPTGWRPKDVKDKYPIEVVTDVFARPKYDSRPSRFLHIWSWTQLVINNLLMYYMLTRIADFSFQHILLYAAFLMVSVFAYTTLMDKHKLAIAAELIKLVFGAALMYLMNGWYQIDEYFQGATFIVGLYFILSAAMTVYFIYFDQSDPDRMVAQPNLDKQLI